MTIRELKKSEWTDAMALCWKTFLKFEAEEYGKEGVQNFYRFVTSYELEAMFLNREYIAFGAFDGDTIVGFIGLRNGTYLSLLFVDESYHHRGIATALVAQLIAYLQEIFVRGTMTVHSSPYAREFYHHLGFRDIGSERRENGIVYIPMEIEF